MAAKQVTMAQFVAAMNRAENRLRGQQPRENFGAKDVRALEDMVWGLPDGERRVAFQMVNDFADWCGNYTGR